MNRVQTQDDTGCAKLVLNPEDAGAFYKIFKPNCAESRATGCDDSGSPVGKPRRYSKYIAPKDGKTVLDCFGISEKDISCFVRIGRAEGPAGQCLD